MLRQNTHRLFGVKPVGLQLLLKRAGLLSLSILLALVQVAFLFIAHPQKADANVDFVGSSSATTASGSSVTIPKPTGTQLNDTIIVFVVGHNDSGGSVTAPDSNWDLIADTTDGDYRAKSYYKIATISEPANYTFTIGSGSVDVVGVASVYRGAYTIDPIDGLSSTGDGTSSVHTAPSSSTTASNTRNITIFYGVTADTSPLSWTPTTPSSMSERADQAEGAPGFYIGAALYDIPQSLAGTISAKTATASSNSLYWAYQFVMRPADPARLMLFWDEATAPTGWSFVTEANDKYLRGEAPANYGLTGGNANHMPSVASTSHSQPSSNRANDNSSPNGSLATHTHDFSVTVSTEDNLPEYRSLKLIQYDDGIPEFIPEGAIALFDSTPGIPSDEISPGNPLWSQYADQDGYFVRADDTVATGGNPDNTHEHDLTWSALGAATGQAGLAPLLFNSGTASPGHTHNAPPPTTTSTNGTDPCDIAPVDDTCLPPYVDVLLAEINQDTETISIGFTAMFDKDPGGGWVLRSDNPGGPTNPFYQRFLKAEDTYADNGGAGFGSGTHQHTQATTTSGAYQGGSPNSLVIGALAPSGHSHTMIANFDPSSNIPEYFNVVIAEKVNFTLENYRWFEDNDAADVTDPWSSQDIPEGNQITILPVANDAPRTNRELRLRIQIEVDNNDLVAGGIAFKLQYKAGVDGECDTGTWADVGDSASGVIWRYANSSVANGTDLSPYASEFSAASDVMQMYINDPIVGNNPYAVGVGETMEYDFHIQHNGADGATQYSFRVVEDSGPGVLLSEYRVCPTLETFPDTNQQLRHGNYFEIGQGEGGFSWSD